MKINLTGLKRLQAKLSKIENLDPTLLLASWADTMESDNRKGVLAGLDKDGNPLKPVTYRPKGPTVRIGAKSAGRFRNHATRKGVFGGFGPMAAGLHNNLTRGEYEQLTGPPLAPRGAFSRVVTNFATTIVQTGPRTWSVVAGWREVVTVKGKPFLAKAFATRDLRGVRPEGLEKARKAFVAWARDMIKFSG